MNKLFKKILLISFIFIITIFGIVLEICYLLKNNKSENIKISNNQIYLEKETIETTINKINNLLTENGISIIIDKENLIEKNNVYYYQIYENIYIYIKPLEYIGNILLETTHDIGIYYPIKSDYEGNAKIYLKILVKSNNDSLSDDDIESLIDSAINYSKENKSINYKGISIQYFGKKDNNYKEFIIRRNYE